MRKKIPGIVSVSFLIFWCITGGAKIVYGQCGADGTKPCGSAAAKAGASSTKASKTNSTKKIAGTKLSPKEPAAATQVATETKKAYALVIMENANLRESATVYSASIREVELNEKLLLIRDEPVGPWYKVFDSKTQSEGWLHGNTIEVVYDNEKNKNKRTPSEAVIKTQINICTADVRDRVNSATETFKNAVGNGDNETAIEQLDFMKTAILQQRRCLNTGLRLKTISEQERAAYLDSLQETKELLETIEESRKKLIQAP